MPSNIPRTSLQENYFNNFFKKKDKNKIVASELYIFKISLQVPLTGY